MTARPRDPFHAFDGVMSTACSNTFMMALADLSTLNGVEGPSAIPTSALASADSRVRRSFLKSCVRIVHLLLDVGLYWNSTCCNVHVEPKRPSIESGT